MGRGDEAEACYRKAISQTSRPSVAHENLCSILLTQGNFQEAWQYHELRHKPGGYLLHSSVPQWKGEAAEGKTLLVCAEQGYGDTLQFCRYVPIAAERGVRITLVIRGALVRLLGCLPGVDMMVSDCGFLPVLDLHCPMMSLPMALGTNSIADIPSSVPYLFANPDAAAVWRKRLSALAKCRLRVGLIWAGLRRVLAEDIEIDSRRSMDPAFLTLLSHVSHVQFFSLQKDGPPAPPELELIDYMSEMTDFADTAALIANLDLVISVDTAVAHLAGAMGKSVWLLDRFDNCWRWLEGRTDSPWYPTMRIFRQPAPGDWGSVVADVKRDLQALSSSRSATHGR